MNRFTHKLDATHPINDEIFISFTELVSLLTGVDEGEKSDTLFNKLYYPFGAHNGYETLTLFCCLIAEMSEEDINECFPEFDGKEME